MNRVEALVIMHDKRVFAVIEVRSMNDNVLTYDDAVALKDCLMIHDPKRHQRSPAQYQVLPKWPAPDGVQKIWGTLTREQSGHSQDLEVTYDFEMLGANSPAPQELLSASGGHQIWPGSVVLNVLN